MNWDTGYAIALLPIGAAILVSLLIVALGGSADAGQWAAVVTFFVTLPFVVGRLIDRAK
jgi:cyanophycinase-like exopeptidase